ncbi:MAG: ATP-dependent Clp protease proteolytic subunit [Synergistaceae bacterium]|nr:ATP-dependent Clp protease proteolytic subunit [Synergistaceae bacterium]
MYKNRKSLYEDLENRLKSKLLVYITSDRRGFETQIARDVIDIFINQLDTIGNVSKISLYLYTRGGETAAAWNIINLLKLYCDELQVIVPHKAHSAGTLICIGANSIIMTKQATLGPIDPNVNTFLNPPIPGAPPQKTFPVSVEAVKGYLAFAKEELSIKDDAALASIMIKLSDAVHPLVLGEVYRSRAQIKMLAEKLLTNQIEDPEKIQQIIEFLCSDSGSHDYTINRREAKNMGLQIDKPDEEVYKSIKAIYDDISSELGFETPFDLVSLARAGSGSYSIKRALIESIAGGSDYFVTQGKATLVPMHAQPGMPQFGIQQQGIQDERIYEGWLREL